MRLSDHFGSGGGLVITGSLAIKADDRVMDRASLAPVQLVTQRGVERAGYFDSFGAFGVSSIAFAPGASTAVFSTGNDARIVGSGLETDREMAIGIRLGDVHEMDFSQDGRLLIANTAHDEGVIVRSAVPLAVGRLGPVETIDLWGQPCSRSAAPKPGGSAAPHFHVNQLFESFSGELHALVHHISGWQVKRDLATRLLKSQGDGGVVNLRTGQRHDLGLSGPHSVRRVASQYWVLDSGRHTCRIFDQEWKEKDRFSTPGWGRGAALSSDGGHFYIGLSPIRKRYQSLAPRADIVDIPTVQVINVTTLQTIGLIELPSIEQINNVYSVDQPSIDWLRRLPH